MLGQRRDDLFADPLLEGQPPRVGTNDRCLNLGLIGNWKAFDAYPFEFLSVMVSLEAIFLTLFVLASQNRQRTRDRIRADIEFESSINTEMKIAYPRRQHSTITSLKVSICNSYMEVASAGPSLKKRSRRWT